MHEHIALAGITADEAITLRIVEPFHCSFFHFVAFSDLNC